MSNSPSDFVIPKVTSFRNLINLSSSWGNTDHNDDIFDLPKLTDDDGDGNNSTFMDQIDIESKCKPMIREWLLSDDQVSNAAFNRRKTIQYLLNGIETLSTNYLSQDCSRPWICYWILNSLNLLNALNFINNNLTSNIISFLNKCQNKSGGYAGGPGQYSHILTSYAAIMALLTIGNEEAYKSIDRQSFYKFLMRQKMNDGSYSCHDDGEIDIRAIYCGLSCAAILNILDDKLVNNTLKWIEKCQTYQGGFSQEPYDEAHGGYAYCGVASLVIIRAFLEKKYKNIKYNINIDNLIRWQVYKQMSYSGGFQGRTNKLVDACYSYWVGAVFPMINIIKIQNANMNKKDNIDNNNNNTNNMDNNPTKTAREEKMDEEMALNNNNNNNNSKSKIIENDINELDMILNMDSLECNIKLFHSMELQKYLLIIAQKNNSGGIADKPPKPADYYHTCYGLNGLSVAQQYGNKILGPSTNKLQKVNPVYGITSEKLRNAWKYFSSKPFKPENK